MKAIAYQKFGNIDVFQTVEETNPSIQAILSSPSAKNMDLLLSAINNGLQIEASKVFPFHQTKEAYQYAVQGGHIGKVTVELN